MSYLEANIVHLNPPREEDIPDINFLSSHRNNYVKPNIQTFIQAIADASGVSKDTVQRAINSAFSNEKADAVGNCPPHKSNKLQLMR